MDEEGCGGHRIAEKSPSLALTAETVKIFALRQTNDVRSLKSIADILPSFWRSRIFHGVNIVEAEMAKHSTLRFHIDCMEININANASVQRRRKIAKFSHDRKILTLAL